MILPREGVPASVWAGSDTSPQDWKFNRFPICRMGL